CGGRCATAEARNAWPTSCSAPCATSPPGTGSMRAAPPRSGRCSRSGDSVEIAGLDDAARRLGGTVLGPRELKRAPGFDPFAVLSAEERTRIARLPFTPEELDRARADGELLVLRLPRDPEGPLTMLRLGQRLAGGLDTRVHKGVGYMLRDEWTIDD